MSSTRTVVALLSPILLSACVIDARRADTVIGPERTLDIPVAPTSVVDVRIPAGDVDIVGVEGDRLTAEMVVKCADEESRCAKRLGDVQFVTSTNGDEITVGMNKDSSWKYREGHIQVTVRIPPVQAVNVDMTAGDLSIEDIQGCLTVDMGAGDVDVDIPVEQVAHVRLDAGMGDASMEVDGRHRYAPRSWLVGAELEWGGGSGHCDVDVDLQAGDIFVELSEG